MIPPLDLRPEIELYGESYAKALKRVALSGEYILGKEVRAFETEAADYLNARFAIGVNSGTDALTIGLRALGVKPGDEVITSPFSFFATAETIALLGAVPVFADIDPKTFNLCPKQIAAKISPRTKGIVPVHLFGLPAAMDEIQAIAAGNKLFVLEDAAQAFGASYRERKAGVLGDAAAFSFYPTKNLGGLGDGGLLVTSDERVAQVARLLRAHGSRERYYHEDLGYASRLDELQAAVLRIKLGHLDSRTESRRQIARRYHEALSEIPGVEAPEIPRDSLHGFHQYTIRITGKTSGSGDRRDLVRQGMTDLGIGTMIYYPVPLHRISLFGTQPACPEAERAASEVLSLPLWPEMTTDTQHQVIEALRDSCVANMPIDR